MASLLEKLQQSENIAKATKAKRLFSHPFKYLFAIGYKNIFYRFFPKGILVSTGTFWGKKMDIILPAGTDIYLTGGKSHDSEIRLAKFLITHLTEGDCFIDVGAHFGYFSLLGSEVVGDKGKVYAFEAAESTFHILKKNVSYNTNITVINKAVSDAEGVINFYEFPVLYSEYDTMNIEQFENDNWYSKYQPKKISVETVCLDTILSLHKLNPRIIKIDVEGAENKVISGASKFLEAHPSIIVMEYLNVKRHNTNHQMAKTLLEQLGFTSYVITAEGALLKTPDIDSYLTRHQLESDNIVFTKG